MTSPILVTLTSRCDSHFERSSASKKINRIALIQTRTVSIIGFERKREEFYGFRQTVYGENYVVNVNEARSVIFWKKLNKTSKVSDISLLPPCMSSLKKQANHANFIARMWRKASEPKMNLNKPQFNGWMADLKIDRIDEAFPDHDVAEQ